MHLTKSSLIKSVALLAAAMMALIILLRITGQLGIYTVPTGTMASFINAGDTIIVQALTLHGQPPQRGDVLTFTTEGIAAIFTPDDVPQMYVMRVAGLPGDTLQVVDGVLRINDRPASEYYNVSHIKYVIIPEASPKTALFTPYTVPPDRLFMLGDNSENSSDSRLWGPLPMKNVRHRYWFHASRAEVKDR